MSTTNVAQDLLTKVKAIPAFNNRVGLAVGGRATDPAMQKVPVPAAWIILLGDENVSTTTQITCAPRIRSQFQIQIIMDYNTEVDLFANAYPLLDEVRNAIHSSLFQGERWNYTGQILTELTGRMIYEQTYTLTTSA